jgi:hypothetical protein
VGRPSPYDEARVTARWTEYGLGDVQGDFLSDGWLPVMEDVVW